jgi:carbonic anhydrase
MSNFDHLINGYNTFKATASLKHKDLAQHMVRQGTKPDVLVITCSDLQISAETILSSNPGELYVVRNVAGLVPPHDHQGAAGAMAGIEYAANILQVKTIIILGHSHCYGIKNMMKNNEHNVEDYDPLDQWLLIGDDAKKAVQKQLHDRDLEEQCSACEKESVLMSVKNLLAYPWVQGRIKKNDIEIYGWHFDMLSGDLLMFNPENGQFDPV